METRLIRISGRVQGVGFRYATRLEAERLGLRGWVRNCPDHTVETCATGSAVALDAFQRWLHHGPPGARVKQVEVSSIELEPESEQESTSPRFEIRR